MPNTKSDLTHLDEAGHASMVNVGMKPDTERCAVATGKVRMKAETLALIVEGSLPKGDVFAVARIAGIQAAKQCSNLIPLCHLLLLNSVQVDLKPDPTLPGVQISATCRVSGKTGVEMEALTAVSVAALTLYDMCKAVDRGMSIEDVRVETKTGGASGTWQRGDPC
ncbi:cyclic pyranopterin monophosphate synthase MoaC [Luminiphilus sp.]|nr:cyclic pyranopterin monophosphate synthase MoaC [Luminiphilus sp.]MDB4582504.1 cyclic pyranopterin monophosphate synthase MoaC [Draconibacterium sp.]MDA9848057.1 cyclic pyranopterin monophosphate synthase MoaC [Luminiphilus sp.]MDB2352393.1 cyclic pyranopterin monophosphate synthase MoaC [Luminiphilus sp.]MDB2615663.1 cyclic pyranopterin monophosphate synthase MoaC [Luminiphilus sp.]